MCPIDIFTEFRIDEHQLKAMIFKDIIIRKKSIFRLRSREYSIQSNLNLVAKILDLQQMHIYSESMKMYF